MKLTSKLLKKMIMEELTDSSAMGLDKRGLPKSQAASDAMHAMHSKSKEPEYKGVAGFKKYLMDLKQKPMTKFKGITASEFEDIIGLINEFLDMASGGQADQKYDRIGKYIEALRGNEKPEPSIA